MVYFEQHSIRVIGTHQKVSSVEFYRASENEIFNIPKSQMTVTWDTEINASLFSQVSLQYLSSRLSPIRIASNNVVLDDPFPDQGVSFDEPNNRLTSVMLFNATLRWKLKSYPIELSLSAQNLLDKKWRQGGTTIHPYPQTGRWIQLGIRTDW